MPTQPSRRGFLCDVGKGMLVASVGAAMARDLGLAAAAETGPAAESDRLDFGPMESLVRLMQETAPARLNQTLVERMRGGATLKQLAAAATLANARTFGGEDYVGFHTLMAIGPAYRMSGEITGPLSALPVLKVLYRNTSRIHDRGSQTETLRRVAGSRAAEDSVRAGGESLRAAVRRRDVNESEKLFAGIALGGAEDAFNALLVSVSDDVEVHRTVLPYRAWDVLDVVGREHAHTLLRQSVRYCIQAESWAAPESRGVRELLPRLMEQYGLLDRAPGDRRLDDAAAMELSRTIFSESPARAAEAAAAALKAGVAPDEVGEAVSLAANQLVLRDAGRTFRDEVPGKPLGSVHGDSIGVHASDSANAWRNMARVAAPRNAFACIILGAYQAAFDRIHRGGDFLNWQPLPLQLHLDQIKTQDASILLKELETAIRGNLQARAAAIAHRYGQQGHPAPGVFELLRKFAISEDGALHAEKYYRTVSEEFASTRPALRWRHVSALARVTASEFGRPAAGVEEARTLLQA